MLLDSCGNGFSAIGEDRQPKRSLRRLRGRRAFGASMNAMNSTCCTGQPDMAIIVFRNYQWRAEKRDSILRCEGDFVGAELNTI